jgi:hypothetical protein
MKRGLRWKSSYWVGVKTPPAMPPYAPGESPPSLDQATENQLAEEMLRRVARKEPEDGNGQAHDHEE